METAESRRRWTWHLLLAGVASASLLVTMPGAVSRPLTGDEVSSAIVVSEPGPVAALRQVATGESGPPVWYASAWVLHQGRVPVTWLRLVSALAMALAAAGTAVIARQVGLPRAACVAAGLLVAWGDQFVNHGAELRAYGLFSLLTVMFGAMLLHAAEHSHRARAWPVGLIVAAGSMTHYYFVLAVAAAVIWLWATPALRSVRLRLLRAIGIGLFPLILWSPAFAHQWAAQRYSWIGPFSAHTAGGSANALFINPWAAGSLPRIVDFAGLALAVAGAIALRRTEAGRLVALLALVPPGVAALAWWLGSPVFDTRNLLGAGLYLAIAIVAALTGAPRIGWLATAAAMVAVVASLISVRMHLGRTDFRRVSDSLVTEGWRRGDPVVVFGTVYGSVPIAWYLPGHPRLDPGQFRPHSPCAQVFVVAETAAGRRWLRAHASTSVAALPARGTTDWAPTGPPILVASLPGTDATRVGLLKVHAPVYATRGTASCVQPLP